MSVNLQAPDDVHIWVDPELVAAAMKDDVSREEQLRNPLSQAVADLNPGRPWHALYGRQQEVEFLIGWVTDNFGEHTCYACISHTVCTYLRSDFD